ncbi:EAL domain-containing protein, partial [uncultured Roseobacter sp.]|uniref:EAL domain-containing protein n=1 Tax=uncultured Roseobacter sp. TaxID=114847 RepID=UPI0026139B66
SRKSNDSIMTFAETLRIAITEPIDFSGLQCQIGATIGLATWSPIDPVGVEQALMDADTALIAGKSMGRNQTVLFQEDMRGLAVKNARIAAQIKVGLSEEAFEPFYQPQIATPRTRLIDLEALARWKQPDGTYAPASSFIDVANETGLITEIDHVACCFNRIIAAGRRPVTFTRSSAFLDEALAP